MRLPIILSAAALALAACGAPAEPPEEAVEPTTVAETAAAETAEPPPAIGFLTFNPAPPSDAIDKNNDGIKRDADGRPYNYALLGQKLPAFTAPISTGGTFNSADIEKWTVIDVWGVWCGDCVADGPYVAALERAIAQDPDLDFVSLHTPASAARTSPEELFKKYGSLEAYFDSAGYSFPVVLDQDASIRAALQITWTPSYLLVSPDGIVRGFRTDLSVAGGEPVKDFIRDIAEVRKDVKNLLASDPSDVQ
jgi:thiol-disulfide isomerase/thioredoxin